MRVLEMKFSRTKTCGHVLLAYEALREAYNLSGRYEQDEAYPGKALKLLEQSLSHAEHSAIKTSRAVQSAIEQSKGVKEKTADAGEEDTILNLEDLIHQGNDQPDSQLSAPYHEL